MRGPWASSLEALGSEDTLLRQGAQFAQGSFDCG